MCSFIYWFRTNIQTRIAQLKANVGQAIQPIQDLTRTS